MNLPPDLSFTAQSTPRGWDIGLGIEYLHIGPDIAQARIEVNPNHYQPTNIVHGGVYCSIVESLGSLAGTAWLDGKGYCVGVNNNTDFIKACREGALIGTATPIHRGKSQQLWTITIMDEKEVLYAVGKLRLHNMYPQPIDLP